MSIIIQYKDNRSEGSQSLSYKVPKILDIGTFLLT